ncbi:hypothetical protein PIB30_047274 [Stylosanthes scabra]|uniref:Uncharacterized protein n=1 Tax=Stylosanthes scabra TaxID=79078 RepID=A0ABU6SGJ0_9FABA|nr:hypothetical protein [Stylosanthes scabra]
MEKAEKERVIVEGDNGMEEEKDEVLDSHSQTQQQPNTSLAELNMLLVFLSLKYNSTDESIEGGEGEGEGEGEEEESTNMIREREEVPVAKTTRTLSRIQNKRNDPKLGRRSFSTRFQTTIRDSRHGRRM